MLWWYERPSSRIATGDWVESKDQDPNGDVRLTQLADIGEGRWLDKSARFLTAAKAKQLRCTYLKSGDVLVARMPDPLGRATVFPGDEMPCVSVVDVCIMRPGGAPVLPGYLAACLNTLGVRSQIMRHATGTTRQRISRKNLGKVSVLVPPLDMQERFLAVVSAVDEQRSQLTKHLAELDTLFASLQQRAFAGAL